MKKEKKAIKILGKAKNWKEVKEMIINSFTEEEKQEIMRRLNRNQNMSQKKRSEKTPYRDSFDLFIYGNKYPVYNFDSSLKEKVWQKLQNDVIKWMWRNSDVILDKFEDEHIINKKTKDQFYKNSFIPGKRGFKCFLYNKEHQYCNDYLKIRLSEKRIKLLKNYLIDKGWHKDSILKVEDCPAFLKEQKTKDHIVIFFTLIGWKAFKEDQKEKVIKYFKSKKYKYYPKDGMMKIQRCKNSKTEYIYNFEDMYKIKTDNRKKLSNSFLG